MDTNMTTKTLLDEYAGCFRVVDNCESDAYICEMCKGDEKRMQEIAQELEASIRKDTIAEMRALDVATLPERGVLEQKIRKEVEDKLMMAWDDMEHKGIKFCENDDWRNYKFVRNSIRDIIKGIDIK